MVLSFGLEEEDIIEQTNAKCQVAITVTKA